MISAVRATKSAVFVTASLFLFVVSGCGKPAGPAMGKVTGKVTLDGQALAKATVMFIPDGGAPSLGVTDESGRYRLEYSSNTSGAVVSPKHTVRITTAQPEDEDKDGKKIASVPEKVPEKYNLKSELTREVKAGSNTLDFELKSK